MSARALTHAVFALLIGIGLGLFTYAQILVRDDHLRVQRDLEECQAAMEMRD